MYRSLIEYFPDDLSSFKNNYDIRIWFAVVKVSKIKLWVFISLFISIFYIRDFCEGEQHENRWLGIKVIYIAATYVILQP